jgi:hypothetical protein
MKKIALAGLVTLCSVAAYAQGVVTFVPQYSGLIDVQVYGPSLATPTVEEQGSTVAQDNYNGDSTAGAVTYTGTLLGGSSYTGSTPVSFAAATAAATTAGLSVYNYGNLFTAELYALSTTTSMSLPGGLTLASLSPVTQYESTFATSSAPYGAGFFNQAIPASPDPGVPGTGYLAGVTPSKSTKGAAYLGNNAAAAVVAWYSGGGQFQTYSAAQAGSVPTGYSAIFEITGLIEPASVMTEDNNNVAAAAQNGTAFLADNCNGDTWAQSFSLTTQTIPEPSTIALGVMGACAFLARRRKK